MYHKEIKVCFEVKVSDKLTSTTKDFSTFVKIQGKNWHDRIFVFSYYFVWFNSSTSTLSQIKLKKSSHETRHSIALSWKWIDKFCKAWHDSLIGSQNKDMHNALNQNDTHKRRKKLKSKKE